MHLIANIHFNSELIITIKTKFHNYCPLLVKARMSLQSDKIGCTDKTCFAEAVTYHMGQMTMNSSNLNHPSFIFQNLGILKHS